MKKLIILFTFSLFTTFSFGQELENQFYLRLGYSSPSWSQYGLNEQEWNQNGFNNRGGATFEIGSIFMLNSILVADNASLGINVDYLYFTYNTFNNDQQNFEVSLVTGRIGSKIGPSFTYSPAKRLAFDIYAKADFAWVSGATIYEDNIRDADDYFSNVLSFGFSGGLNIRYSLLMIGFEYNTISPKMESVDIDGLYLQNIIDEMADKSSTDSKSKLPCINFTIGLTF